MNETEQARKEFLQQRQLGCLRLGARIYDLKRAGYPIAAAMVDDVRTGKRYACYSMVRSGGLKGAV